MNPKFKKSFHKFVEHVDTNPLINNTLNFDQYSCLAICFDIFRFSAINSKTNLKFEFVELVETNLLMYNIKDLG